VLRSLWHVLHNAESETLESDLTWLSRLLDVGQQLQLGISLSRAQELYLRSFYEQILPLVLPEQNCPNGSVSSPSQRWTRPQVQQLLKVGQQLAVDVTLWLEKMS
jgi:hypothetical protein